MFQPLTPRQWLISVAISAPILLVLVKGFGIPAIYTIAPVVMMAIAGWQSFTAYREKLNEQTIQSFRGSAAAAGSAVGSADARNRKLEPLHKCLNNLTGDRDVSHRLLMEVMTRYPGRSMEWCLEKTIDDLIRDRR